MRIVNIKTFINDRVDSWLSRRVPGKSEHVLTRNNIFILPTKFGLLYLLFVFLLFLLGTNYQNNIIMLMSYLLASFFITVMMHSFYNLAGLSLTSHSVHYGFAKQTINVPISISASKPHFDLTFGFAKYEFKTHVENCEKGQTVIHVPYLPSHRGLIPLGRVKVSSEYSFGLFNAWSMLDFSHQATVYPQQIKILPSQYQKSDIQISNNDYISNETSTAGIEEFSELRKHVVGEPMSRIAWKQLARGQGKYTKHYHSQQGSIHLLKLSDMPNTSLELQLSYLSYLIVEASQTEQRFGLDLTLNSNMSNPDSEDYIEPNSGQAHKLKCLSALACFNQSKRGTV